VRHNEDIKGTPRDPLQCWVTYIACALLLVQSIAYNFVDIDLWHQMALIRESLAACHLLRSDPYAYTATLPWIDHEWGAGAIAYFATYWLNSRAIIALKYSCALGTLLTCIRCAETRGADFRQIGLCAPLAIFLASLGFLSTVRAQDYSFLFTAIWLLFLEYDRRGSRIWMAPALVIFVIWVNLHAGFVLVLALTAIHAAENGFRREPYRHLGLLLCVMGLEIFLNPYGAAYFLYLKRALLMPRPYSAEWGGVTHLGAMWFTAYVVAILIAVAAASYAGWLRARGLPWLAITAAAAGMHRKLLPLFAIAWLCYVPTYVQPTRAGLWWQSFAYRRRLFLVSVWAFVACICAYAACRDQIWELQVPQPLYPVGAVEYLGNEKFHGNLMVPFRIGAYVSWKLYPATKVSVDSRYEVAYPDSVVKRVFDFYDAAPGWQTALTDWPTDAALVPRDTSVAHLISSVGWQRVYSDLQFEIYVRPGIVLPATDMNAAKFRGIFP
jgi:hypothetical protein